MDIKKFSIDYISKLKNILDKLDVNVFREIVYHLDLLSKNNGRLFVIGNGGSASTASHIVNDFGVGLKRRGIVNLDVYSLCDNNAVVSAVANDIGYENIFYMQLKNILKQKDLLIAISCSGNSPNILKAVEYAKSQGVTIVGVTGFDGGKLKSISDINFHINTDVGDYGLVEDAHMIFGHIIYSFYIERGQI